MCGDSWYIDEDQLDDYQLDVLRRAPDKASFIVTGCAGSGKTNLAIWKAQDIQSNNKGSFLLIVYTKALRIFIEDGISNAEINRNRVMHYKLWVRNGKPSADYIIVDEAQDFTHEEIKEFRSRTNKALILYGDQNQQIFKDFEDRTGIVDIKYLKNDTVNFPYSFDLILNHRLPRKIAEAAEHLLDDQDYSLSAHCTDEGNERPNLRKFSNSEEQYNFIINKIETEQLTHVGILLPYKKNASEVYKYFREQEQNVQVRINEFEAGEIELKDLEFNSPVIPKILTYHSAKGLQFQHVFLPDCSLNFHVFKPALYVAMTRPCQTLSIYYSDSLSPYIDAIDRNLFNEDDDMVFARPSIEPPANVYEPEDDLPF
jgi:DNA helicase IV